MVKILGLLFLMINSVFASNNAFMVKKINTDFNDTWYELYDNIEKYGYKTAYLQRCDFALKQRNYQSDKYRILFFGEYDNMLYLTKKYPEIVPFIPLKVVVAARGKTTELIANSPEILLTIVKGKDKNIIHKWQKDMAQILLNVMTKYEKTTNRNLQTK